MADKRKYSSTVQELKNLLKYSHLGNFFFILLYLNLEKIALSNSIRCEDGEQMTRVAGGRRGWLRLGTIHYSDPGCSQDTRGRTESD